MTNLTKSERAKLELEYRELCEDWRWRDKYVLDKLAAAGVLFGLLGFAISNIPENNHLIKLCLLFIGGLFSIILSISVIKDTYYRDGTEKLLRRLSAQLGINSSLQSLKSLKGFKDGLNFKKLQFSRKISINPNKSSLKIPPWLRNCLLKQPTFGWILVFYLGSLLIFIILIGLLVFDWIAGSPLPF